MDAALVRVFFRLHADQQGYPPATVESVWARTGDNAGEYVLENTPFLASEATLGDTVTATLSEGQLWFGKTISHCGNSLLRVAFFQVTEVERVTTALTDRGCSVEYASQYKLLAVSIPSSASLASIREYLAALAEQGALDYEEALLTQ